MSLIEELEKFIRETSDGKEIKRAVAVKLQLQGQSYQEIQRLLQVSQSFISKWKNRAIFDGVDSLKLQYRGGTAKLSEPQKQEVIAWLRTLEYCKPESLQLHLERKYNVIFHSPQSYYSLLKEAKISWKKTQKVNPHQEPELVALTQSEFKKNSSIGKMK